MTADSAGEGWGVNDVSCFAGLGEEFGGVICLEVGGVVVADSFDIGFDAEAFADCFEASFEG